MNRNVPLVLPAASLMFAAIAAGLMTLGCGFRGLGPKNERRAQGIGPRGYAAVWHPPRTGRTRRPGVAIGGAGEAGPISADRPTEQSERPTG